MSYHVTVTECSLTCDEDVVVTPECIMQKDGDELTFKELVFKWTPSILMLLAALQKIGVRGHVVFQDNEQSFDKYELHDDGVSNYCAVLKYDHVGELDMDALVSDLWQQEYLTSRGDTDGKTFRCGLCELG